MSRPPTTCSRCATSSAPTGRCRGPPGGGGVERTVRHFRALERIFDEVAARRRGARGRQRDDAHRGAPDRARARHRTCCSSSTRSSRTRCGCTATRCTRRSWRSDELRALSAAERGGGRGVHRALHGRRQADPRVPRARASRRRKLRDFARHVAVSADRRPRQRVPAPAALRHQRACASARARWRRGALYEPLDPRAAVRLLPAARHRRLQDQARDPALLRPGVDHRAGRRLAAAGLRPRAQGAPDVDRAQPALAAAAAARGCRTSGSSRRTRARTS